MFTLLSLSLLFLIHPNSLSTFVSPYFFCLPAQDKFKPEHVNTRSSCELLGFMDLNFTLNFGSCVTLDNCFSGYQNLFLHL